jgi:hypothetical protein
VGEGAKRVTTAPPVAASAARVLIVTSGIFAQFG